MCVMGAKGRGGRVVASSGAAPAGGVLMSMSWEKEKEGERERKGEGMRSIKKDWREESGRGARVWIRDEVRDGGLNGGWTEGAEWDGEDGLDMGVGGVGAAVFMRVTGALPMPGDEGNGEVDGPVSRPGLDDGGREGGLEDGGAGRGAMAVSNSCR